MNLWKGRKPLPQLCRAGSLHPLALMWLTPFQGAEPPPCDTHGNSCELSRSEGLPATAVE